MPRKYVVIDRCPVPAKLAEEVNSIKAQTGATLNSCYRGHDALDLLHANGKSSQQELYDLFLQGRGNPANPPGRSTHELRNDGVAYPLPVGVRLPYWMCGMDWSDAPAVVAAAKARKFTATVTYPGNPREGHHVNFRKEPILNLFRPLKRGSRGRRVAQLCRRLRYLGYDLKIRGVYDADLDADVREFQQNHHQAVDGVYGLRTHRQMLAAVRRRKRRRRDEIKRARRKKKKGAGADLSISDKGLKFIAEFEGFRAAPYNDAAGHATIGYGHLLHHGPVTARDRDEWQTISREHGLRLLRGDASIAVRAVNDKVTVRLNQHQFDALVSFTFNLGTGALAESTLLRKLNAHHHDSVPSELARWTKAGGRELAGLVRRRRAEGRVWTSGNYSTN